MNWKPTSEWPTKLCECLIAIKVDDKWFYERALPDPSRDKWHSLESIEPVNTIEPILYWAEIDDPC